MDAAEFAATWLVPAEGDGEWLDAVSLRYRALCAQAGAEPVGWPDFRLALALAGVRTIRLGRVEVLVGWRLLADWEWPLRQCPQSGPVPGECCDEECCAGCARVADCWPWP